MLSANECTSEEIMINNAIYSNWTVDCNSTHRSGSYAKYYTFTLVDTKYVSIDLNSSIDTYLYLMADTNQSAVPIAENDDNGADLNSSIKLELTAGTYTIEATTYDSNQTGDFALSLQEITVEECRFEEITVGSTIYGEWTIGCESVNRPDNNAKYYTFTLETTQKLQMDLVSQIDTYLYLMSGIDQAGAILAENDDYSGTSNSRITIFLDAGTYTIEATTYGGEDEGGGGEPAAATITNGPTGPFTLSLKKVTLEPAIIMYLLN